MSFPAYPSYSDSGVEWLGEAPSHWLIAPLKRRAHVITERTERRTRPVALENIEGWTGRLIESDTEFEAEGIAYEAGDLLYGKLRPYLAKAHAAQSPGEAVGDFHVLRPRQDICGRYLMYALLTREIVALLNGSTFGAKMPRVSWEFMGMVPFAFPPKVEQAAIVAFLDRETAKIDALVDEQRRLIELLKEKRQAVIAHAVTKGLDPTVPMKVSSVEWLGEVPAHWEIRRAKHVFSQSALPVPEDADVVTCFRDGQVTLRSNRREDGFTMAVLEVGYQGIIPGQLVLHSMDAFAGAIGVSDSAGKCSPEYVVCDPLEKDFSPYYYGRLLRLMALRGFIFALCPSVRERAPRIRFSSFSDLEIPVPPASEQREIAASIDKEQERLMGLQVQAEASIELLRERRAVLISAVVTGKIDVREAVTHQAKAA